MINTISNATEEARQISEKAQSELATLQAQLPALQQIVVSAQEEEQQIMQRIDARQSRLVDLEHSLQIAHTAHTEAQNYASVASGTVGEANAIAKAVARKKELDDTEQLHKQTKLEHAAADDQDHARLVSIRETHEETMETLHKLHERMRAVEQVKDRSLSELGQHLNTSLSKEYQAFHAHTEDARAALVAAQMDERKFLEGAISQLALWPEHERRYKEAQGVDSPLIRILQAELSYLDQIVSDSREAVRQIDHPNIPVLPRDVQWNWSEVLTVPPNELFYAGFGSAQTVETVKQRRERVQNFLEQCKQVAN